jgi:hypothetical protein
MADAQISDLPSSANGDRPSKGDDWPARASDTIVEYVGLVRSKTTGPALVASRNVVYLVPIGLIGVMLAILLLVLVVRVLVVATAYVPGVELGEPWLAYFVLGGILLLAGAFLWRKKER